MTTTKGNKTKGSKGEGMQLELFIPAKKLMEYATKEEKGNPSIISSRLIVAKRKDNSEPYYKALPDGSFPKEIKTLQQLIAEEGVIKPIKVWFTEPWNSDTNSVEDYCLWMIFDGHHRVIAAYDANPDMEIPVEIVGIKNSSPLVPMNLSNENGENNE